MSWSKLGIASTFPDQVKHPTLAELLHTAENPSPKHYYRNKVSETLDSYIHKNDFYSAEYQVRVILDFKVESQLKKMSFGGEKNGLELLLIVFHFILLELFPPEG